MQVKILLVAAGLLSGVLGSVFFGNTATNTGYIDTGELYNNFQLKKELEQKFTTIETKRTEILDSLELTVTTLSRKLSTAQNPTQEEVDTYQYLARQLQLKEQRFAEDNDALSQKFNEQIWTQINQYVSDFGKEKGLSYIYGANGNGSIMYADKSANLTQEAIAFINNKYTGK